MLKAPLSFAHSDASIQSSYDAQLARLEGQLNEICRQVGEGFEKTALAFELALAQFSRQMTHVLFLKDVSPDAQLRAAAAACDTQIQQYFVDVFAREDLFGALKSCENGVTDPLEKRLVDEHLTAFRRNGLELSPTLRKTFIEKKKRLVEVEEEFGKRLIEWAEVLWLEKNELAGLPPDYIKNLECVDGRFKIKLDYPHYFTFMENAKSDSAKASLEQKFFNRGGERNAQLLEEAIRIRAELASRLGYQTHAEFVLNRRMAKKPAAVSEFLNRLEPALKSKATQELTELLKEKKKEHPDATRVTSSDWRYYDNQLRKNRYNVDTQLIREYFPTEHVVTEMFKLYQTLFGVTFVPIPNAQAWHADVKLYAIEREGNVSAYFYTDLYPREGKYGHAAAFQLVSGYRRADGNYEAPVAAMVANFDPPSTNQPSLLSHDSVETLFHEFGHIMHQTLTTAKYATFSGTAVKTDFVEAPSQMLENWVWNAETLTKLSAHWKESSKKLPTEMLRSLIDAKMLNSAIRYLRQVSFAKIDLAYHTSREVDSTKIYREITEDVMMIPLSPDTRPQASFGHLMGGYDAGYYSYLWSEVFAEDMFTRFQKEGLLNPTVGKDYLTNILEPGGTRDPHELLESFLKREPNEAAFLKSLGL
jgi:thimet oligopeptidase